MALSAIVGGSGLDAGGGGAIGVLAAQLRAQRQRSRQFVESKFAGELARGFAAFVVGRRMTWVGPQSEPWWSWDARSLEIKPTSEPPAANKANPLLLLQLRHAGDISYVNIPHWLVAVLLGAAGVALWRGSRRFTLRTMLGVTALAAVLLGLAARE